MKNIGLFCIVLSLFITNVPEVLYGASEYGYREFRLGHTVAEVQGIIKTKYSGHKVRYLVSGDIELEPASDSMVKALLFFNHVKKLYKIEVVIKYGEVSKVKSRLVESYGQANDFAGEEYFSGDKRYLVSRWLFQDRYRIMLWESYYCRNKKMIPCTVEVHYLDIEGKRARELHKRKVEEEKQYKKDQKTYDGF